MAIHKNHGFCAFQSLSVLSAALNTPFLSFTWKDLILIETMADIFVSYASEDLERVKPLVAALAENGWSVWWDREIGAGSSYDQVIETAIDEAKCVVVVWSNQSIQSEWVRNEADEGLTRDVLVPIQIDDVRPPLAFRRRQTADLIKWTADDPGFVMMVNAINAILGGTAKISFPTVSAPATRRGLPIAIGLVCVAVISLFYFVWRDSLQQATPLPSIRLESDSANKVKTTQAVIRSNWIAVLPFRSVSAANETESELLAEGITGDLINALSGLGMFTVIPHGTVRTYGDSSRSPRQISTELGIRYLIEGRVQMSGEQIRIGITLIDGVEGKTMWKESKDYQGRGLLDIQDDFSQHASRGLDIELLRFESKRVSNLSTEGMHAWEHFVSAMGAWEDPTQESFAMAIREHRKALELEPNYVLSIGQLAALIHVNLLLGELEQEAARSEACKLADRAITLGQESPMALFSGVTVLAEICDEAAKAVQISRRVVKAYPNNGYNLSVLGDVLAISGEIEEGLRIVEDAERSFPDNAYVFRYSPLYKSRIYTELQEWEEVLKVSRTALNLDPSNIFVIFMLANALGALDRPEEAKTAWDQLLSRFPNASVARYEWHLKQGLISDERVEPQVRGLKRAGLGEL